MDKLSHARAIMAETSYYEAPTSDVIVDMQIRYAVDAYELARWDSFGVWVGYLNETGRARLLTAIGA